MLDNFGILLDICDKYGLKVIVGIITGWMSGKMFLPAALYNKNLITDPAACYLQQLFIKGFVPKFKDHPALHAWNLGNECNVMAPVNSRSEAALWVANIANAIRAEDKNHPVYSGMHSLTVDGPWSIIDQGIFTDMLTTHPYAIFCEHTYVDRLLSYRTIMHPTVQGKFYADLSGKPCIAEEFGTTGTYVCGDDDSGDYLRVNLFSLWATGGEGLLWWCANDQNTLTDFPYSRCTLELELGMLTKDKEPKPVLNEMNSFGKLLSSFDFELPKAKTDAVCLLTRDQDHWGVGYMTDLLLRRVGINCSFAFCDNKIPDAKLYIMPSVNGACVIPMERYTELKEKVKAGADLYI
jgi:endo-1,4-beta-mannosidase